jgi:hypothetical protein
MILRILKRDSSFGNQDLEEFQNIPLQENFPNEEIFFESHLRSLGLLTRDLLLFLEAATLEGAGIYLNKSYF